MDISTIIIIVILAAIVFYVVGIFNQLVKLKNRLLNAFAQIEVQLKRRYDLIPNLVESTKAYLSHESETLEAVITARNSAASALKAMASNPSGMQMGKLASAEGGLMAAMDKLSVTIEAYPELKADQTVARLTEELSSTENRIAFARQAYNDDVNSYNTYKQSFPNNFVAGFFGHGENAVWLEFEDSAQIQVAPKVSF
jgi:LemA protein